MGQNPIGDSVEPWECLVARWDLIEFPPDRQEDLGNGVIDIIGSGPATTVSEHMPVEAVVNLTKDSVSIGHINP
jgi:hypothetical protein